MIIPTLNEEATIPFLLRDIQAQSKISIEVVVVDCKSKDNTRKIVRAIKKSAKLSVLLILSDKKGPAYQRNLGAQKAHGEYVVFLDADARLPVRFFETLEEKIKENPGFLYTTYLASFDQGAKQDVLLLDTTNVLLEVVNTIGRPFAAGTSIIADRHVFLCVGGFNTELYMAEDHDFVQRARKAGVTMRVLPEPVVYFSMRRPKQIGYLKFLTQYSISGLQTFFGKEQKKAPFAYPMGGDLYKDTHESRWDISDIRTIREFAKKAARSIGISFSK